MPKSRRGTGHQGCRDFTNLDFCKVSGSFLMLFSMKNDVVTFVFFCSWYPHPLPKGFESTSIAFFRLFSIFTERHNQTSIHFMKHLDEIHIVSALQYWYLPDAAERFRARGAPRVKGESRRFSGQQLFSIIDPPYIYLFLKYLGFWPLHLLGGLF